MLATTRVRNAPLFRDERMTLAGEQSLFAMQAV